MEPAWSPDGRLIAFARFVPESESTELFTVSPDGLGLQQLTQGDRLADKQHGVDRREAAPVVDVVLQLSFSFPSWSAVAISHREGLTVAI